VCLVQSQSFYLHKKLHTTKVIETSRLDLLTRDLGFQVGNAVLNQHSFV
jgi:hypothetical protein